MSSDQQQPHDGHGGWEPLPQGGEYEGDATAFVQLPDDLLDFRSVPRGADPLAAPGHGYTPPPIASAHQQDPAAEQPATGQWTMPFAADGQAPDSGGQWSQYGAQTPAGNGDWQDPDPAQWSVPPAAPDAPDESGEYLVGGQAPYGNAPHPGRQHWTTGAPAGEWSGQQTAEPPHGGTWQDDSDGSGTGYTDRAGSGDYSGGYGAGGGPVPDMNWDSARENWAVPTVDHPAAAHAPTPADQAGHPERAGEAPGDDAAARAADSGEWPVEPESLLAPEDGAPVQQQPHDGTSGPADPSGGPQDADEPPEAAAGPEPAPGDGAEGATETTPDEDPGAAGPDDDSGPVDETAGAAAEPRSEHPHASYVLKVNGTDRPVTDAWIGESLLYVLRERLGLAGAKDGCSQGECGACSVLVDGRLVASCLVPAATAAASEVRTVEGLGLDGAGSDVQRALASHGAVQCGFCVPGLAMTVHDLLEGNHAPTELETRQAISGNLCRCSGYRGVLEAVREVAAERTARAEQEGEEPSSNGTGGQTSGTVRIPHQAGPSDTPHHPTGGPA